MENVKRIAHRLIPRGVTAPLSAYYPLVKTQGFTQAKSLRDRGRGKIRKWRGATGSLMSPCQGTGHFARDVVRSWEVSEEIMKSILTKIPVPV